MKGWAAAALLVVCLAAPRAFAVEDAGAPTTSVSGCVESIPPGAQRPRLTEAFPPKGTSGYAATLRVVVEHGKGETVLPRGLELGSDASQLLKKADFALPDQDGGGAARLATGDVDPKADRVKTTLELQVVPLPGEPGRRVLVLPPLPIAVARANGELATTCTQPHTITVEDPTSGTPEAKPKANPPPRMQREEWTSLKNGLLIGAIALLAGALLALALRRWMARPRPVPPPPPPRPPWEVALEKLDEVRHAGLLEQGRFGEYFDRVNDAVRGYLGARYGFDGLESTTAEILVALRRAMLGNIDHAEIAKFLGDCDLVKFANVTPTGSECELALRAGEYIVRTTMPPAAHLKAPQAFNASPAPPPPPPGGAA
jgi:hypothetical protein